MNKERFNQIIDEAYENYKKEIIRQREAQKKHVEKLRNQGKRLKVTRIELLTKEEFINKCKTDNEFSERWGLKIEERELSEEEKVRYFFKKFGEEDPLKILKGEIGKYNITTKLITLTYNDETIESYE